MIAGEVEFYNSSLENAKVTRGSDFAFGDQEYFETDSKKRKFSAKAVKATSCYTLSYDKAEQYFPKMIEKEQTTLKDDARLRHQGIEDELKKIKENRGFKVNAVQNDLMQEEQSLASEDDKSEHNNDDFLDGRMGSPDRNRGVKMVEGRFSLNRLRIEKDKRPKQ
jgi:hypothetical protein